MATANMPAADPSGKASRKKLEDRIAYEKSERGSWTPEQIEHDLMEVIPKAEWVDFSHRLIHHGRKVCLARSPRCESCSLASLCPKIGVPASRGECSVIGYPPVGEG